MENLKIGIITQARIGSSRLPGKTLLEINNRSLLEIHLIQLLKTNLPVYLATTTEPSALNLVNIASKLGVKSKIGSIDDVLSRYYLCAKENNLDVIIRVTSDCPLICPDLISEGVLNYLKDPDWKNTYLSNSLNRIYPRGMDFEVFSFKALEWLHLNCLDMKYREHVTPSLYTPGSNSFIKKINFRHEKFDLDRSNWRLCVDEPLDFELISHILSSINLELLDYDYLSSYLDDNFFLSKVNESVEQKKI